MNPFTRRGTKMKWKSTARVLGVLPIVVTLGACDLLEVRDPSRYDDEDLNDALEAVANTVEGSAHDYADWYVIWQSLLSDVYMSTGWARTTFGLIDEGRSVWNTYPTTGVNYLYTGRNFPDKMAQHRWFAKESVTRLVDVLGASVAPTDVKLTQVVLGEAILGMYMGLFSCEGVLTESPSEMRADVQIYHEMAQVFDSVVRLVQNVDPEVLEDRPDYLNAARTGRAYMLMLTEDYEGAAAEAAAVPDGFSYDAIHSASSFLTRNQVVSWTTRYRSRQAGLMEWLWPRIERTFSSSYIKDWKYESDFDMRMPVWYSGQFGSDFSTPHYSQWKYEDDGFNIPILHSDLARLIEAEAKMVANDYAGATAILNNLRSRVGLKPLDVPTDGATMQEYLLNERFAELFMEGHRAVDLHRFGLTLERFETFNDPVRRGIGRPTKFPGSAREAQLNPSVENNRGVRCEPAA